MKTISRPFVAITMLLAVIVLFFYSCKKDNASNNNIPPGNNKLSVYLTDDPADYQKVLIDIEQIEVKVDTCLRNSDEDRNQPGCDDDHDERHSNCEIWDTLNINPGIYDLLTLRNGLDTLLASGFLLNGKIERIKFTLGDNNSVEVDSVSYPLNLINHQNFVYVNLGRDDLDSLSSDNLQMYLDFNLDHSIRYFNGQYWLKPVLKPFGLHSSASIEGNVQPWQAFALIEAMNTTDSGFALPNFDGRFKIRGLKPGTYNVLIDGHNGYSDTTLSNITVTANRETSVGTIQLHQ